MSDPFMPTLPVTIGGHSFTIKHNLRTGMILAKYLPEITFVEAQTVQQAEVLVKLIAALIGKDCEWVMDNALSMVEVANVVTAIALFVTPPQEAAPNPKAQ